MTPKASLVTLALLCVSPFCASIAEGQNVVFVNNASFEGVTASVVSPLGLGGNSATGPIGAWTATASGLAALSTSVTSDTATNLGLTSASDGTFAARFTFPIGVANTASLFQNTGVSLLSNSLYTLRLDINPGTFLGAISGVNISLQAGGTTLANLTGANLVSLINANSATFQTLTLNYTTNGSPLAGPLGIQITGGGLVGLGASFSVDNVRLTQTPIPEPSTVAASLAGAGLLGLVMRRRRAMA